MKVSLNLAQYYSNVDLKSVPREELLRRVGAQLGAIEEVIDWAPKYEGAVIVKVISAVKHPNADKLHVCRVDDGGKTQGVERGDDGLIQVVCGAPNVTSGMFAVWLAPGVTVPSTRQTDPFVLEAREIRGEKSNGMLASAKELGISDDHDGIVEVSPEEVGREPGVGDPLVHYFGLDDFVIDCENKMFTHRPDCFGNIGVARELAGISGMAFKSPAWYAEVPSFDSRQDIELTVENHAPELVPRFMAVAMKDVKVRKSPVWLQAFLTRVGIKPINNVVDVTNFVMHLTGQPLHAFDYDKLIAHSNQPSLMPRMSVKGEKLVLLGTKEIELTGEEVVIATDKQAVGLAGVMGGAETEVDDTTTSIVIEAATFDMYNVRRTSMRYGLFTDAVTRFNKGQSPLQNDRVLAFAMGQMNQYTGAEQASQVYDLGDYAKEKIPIELSADFINERLGSSLSLDEMQTLLNNVEIGASTGEALSVHPPFWRMDIEQPEDVVEEIGRLFGYDKLPVSLPARSAKPTPKNSLFEYKQHLRYLLKERGANELVTYSFVHGDLLKHTGGRPEEAFHVRNAISPELQYYRLNLLPSLLAKVQPNLKAQAGSLENHFVLFELGKAHKKDLKDGDGLPVQQERLALVVAADDKTADTQHAGAAYYVAKKYLDAVTGGQATYTPMEQSDSQKALYHPGRAADVWLDQNRIGVIGEFLPAVRRSLKLSLFSAGFELDVQRLLTGVQPRPYLPLSDYPEVKQDITLEVSNAVMAETEEALRAAISANLPEDVSLEEVAAKAAYQPESKELTRMTFGVKLVSRSRSLIANEVNGWLDTAASQLAKSGSAKRV